MIVYKDKISGDDLFTDAYKIQEDGVFYKVFGKTVTEKTQLNEAAFGANPSAEEAADTCDTDAVSGCDIVIANRLVETGFSKKDYKTYIVPYMKRLKDGIQDTEQQQAFMKQANEAVKKILATFDDYRFFQGESVDPDAMVALMDFAEDGISPIMLFFKAGVLEEKQ